MPIRFRKKFWRTSSTHHILGWKQQLSKFKAKSPPTIFLFAFRDNDRPPSPANFEFSQKKELTKRIGATLESICSVTISKCEKLWNLHQQQYVQYYSSTNVLHSCPWRLISWSICPSQKYVTRNNDPLPLQLIEKTWIQWKICKLPPWKIGKNRREKNVWLIRGSRAMKSYERTF